MNKKKPLISVVIPVYNAESLLEELNLRLVQALESITDNFEIIMVNDCSLDNSWDKIKKINANDNDNRFKGINFSRNFGQHNAITAGLDYSSGEWIVVMDCDLQDQPEEIINFYNKAIEGHDLVLGKRINRKDSICKKFFSKYFYFILSYLTDSKFNEEISNFGIYNRKVIDNVISMRENLRFFPTMVKWTGYEPEMISISHLKRPSGKSGYTYKKLFSLAFDIIIGFSYKPLRLTVKFGLLISIISFTWALFLFIRALMGINVVIGWSSLIISIWFLSGIIIFVIGIIGIYITKIFDEVKGRPLYIIKEKVNYD